MQFLPSPSFPSIASQQCCRAYCPPAAQPGPQGWGAVAWFLDLGEEKDKTGDLPLLPSCLSMSAQLSWDGSKCLHLYLILSAKVTLRTKVLCFHCQTTETPPVGGWCIEKIIVAASECWAHMADSWDWELRKWHKKRLHMWKINILRLGAGCQGSEMGA